jgi:hypothetical protein
MVAHKIVWFELLREKECKKMDCKKLKNAIQDIKRFEKEIIKKEKEGYTKIYDHDSKHDYSIESCLRMAKNSRIRIEKIFFKKNQFILKF